MLFWLLNLLLFKELRLLLEVKNGLKLLDWLLWVEKGLLFEEVVLFWKDKNEFVLFCEFEELFPILMIQDSIKDNENDNDIKDSVLMMMRNSAGSAAENGVQQAPQAQA